MYQRQETDNTAIELWIDKDEDIVRWDTTGKFTVLLVEHGSVLLRIDDRPIMCQSPSLLLVNQNSRMEFVNSTLLRASRILFESVFINVNLRREQVCLLEYRQLYREHHIDKLALFMDHDEQYYGLLPLSDTVFQRICGLVLQMQKNLEDTHASHWRCNVRDPLLVILSLAEVVRQEMTGAPTFLSVGKKPKIYISIVAEYLHANHMRTVTVKEVCSLVGVNRDDLSRQFKAHTRKTIMEYLLDCRLEHAVESLLVTERTLYAISKDCGFNSETYFIKMFIRKFGMTPTEYRKSNVGRRKEAFNRK